MTPGSRIALQPRPDSGWEDDINRPAILKRGDGYHLWYTGQARGKSSIGYATSQDGVTWKRLSDRPVLAADASWEKVAVMCPHVLWDESTKLFRMWYSGGEQFEPDAIGYATSPDGLQWTKSEANPIFTPGPPGAWDRCRRSRGDPAQRGDCQMGEFVELARFPLTEAPVRALFAADHR